MNIISARSPQWADKTQTAINLWVTFEVIGEVPFTARADDIEDHGRELYRRAFGTTGQDGEFGPVADFPAPSLYTVKADRSSVLSAACQAQIYAGFQSSALGAVHTYPAKDKDQSNLAASVLSSMYPGLPADWTTPFWCMDGNGVWAFVPHTAAQIQQVGVDGKAAIVSALQKNAALQAQVKAANTVADVEAVTW